MKKLVRFWDYVEFQIKCNRAIIASVTNITRLPCLAEGHFWHCIWYFLLLFFYSHGHSKPCVMSDTSMEAATIGYRSRKKLLELVCVLLLQFIYTKAHQRNLAIADFHKTQKRITYVYCSSNVSFSINGWIIDLIPILPS